MYYYHFFFFCAPWRSHMTQMCMKTQAAMTLKIVGVHQGLCVMTRGHMRPSYVLVAQIHACIYVTLNQLWLIMYVIGSITNVICISFSSMMSLPSAEHCIAPPKRGLWYHMRTGTWVHEYVSTWLLHYMNTWVHVYFTTWIHEYMITSLHEYMSTW